MSQTERSAPAEPLEGTVDHVTFYNPENGFSVVKLRLRGRREPVAVVGTLPAVQPGEVLVLAGRWEIDRVHGARFRPDDVTVRPPSALDDIVRYLSSGLVRQLGPVLARRIVDTFGERTLEVLDAQPERVREVPGIGPQRAGSLAASWVEHRALRAVAAFLAEHHLDTRYAPRLVAAYGQDAPRVLRANPYRLVSEVPGLGFAAADRLGQDLGIRQTAPARLQAAVQAALLKAAEGGHTRLSRETLLQHAARVAGSDPSLLDGAIAQLLAGAVIAAGDGSLADGQRPAAGHVVAPAIQPLVGAEPGLTLGLQTPPAGAASSGAGATPGRSVRLRVYEPTPAVALSDATEASTDLGLSGLVRAESSLAARLLHLAAQPAPLARPRVEAWLARDAGAGTLSDEQRAAVRRAALSGVFVLTGGPGVGKTTTVRVLVRCLMALGRSVALAAPTGKAAKRLGDVVGAEGGEARTVHRLLGAGPQGFRHGARQPLPFDVVVVDEASMLDTQLARAVVAAIQPGGQLILVGDADQLPSVGPGQVLRDLLASGVIAAARLQTVFRQAAQSRIVANAHRIRAGLVPELAPPERLGQGVDCVFVAAPAGRVAELATPWAARRLPRLLGVPAHDVQVLAPLTRVCQTLNGSLQATLNPARGQAERPHGAIALRTGDRVIQTRNNYALGVFNGDTGVVSAIGADDLTVDYGDGQIVEYAPRDVLDLEHAYCLTVHRAQGSEWPGVVLLASSAYGPMLSRNLLYTALTRARRAAVIIGDEAAIARAVAETRDLERSTGLVALLRAGMDGEDRMDGMDGIDGIDGIDGDVVQRQRAEK